MPPASSALASVAVYRRELHSSVERIWENVLDWEHLPWLHSESFSRIECLHAGASGWRARVGLAPARPRIRRSCSSSCSSGRRCATWRARSRGRAAARRSGRGSRRFLPSARRSRSSSCCRASRRAQREALGRAYVRLYTLLWDQDEVDDDAPRGASSPRVPAAAGGAGLARARAARRPASAPAADRSSSAAASCGWSSSTGSSSRTRRSAPTGWGPSRDAPIEDGCVRCPWHGYRFDVRTGRSRDGRRAPARAGAAGVDRSRELAGGAALRAPSPASAFDAAH